MLSSSNKIIIAKKLNSEFISIFGFPLYPFVDIMGLKISDLDDKLAHKDPEYDNVNCTYMGKETAMDTYIKIKYGNRAVQIIKELL